MWRWHLGMFGAKLIWNEFFVSFVFYVLMWLSACVHYVSCRLLMHVLLFSSGFPSCYRVDRLSYQFIFACCR